MPKVSYKDEAEFAEVWPEMYNKISREQKAWRIVKTLGDYYGEESKLAKLTLLDVGASSGIIDNVLAGKFGKVVGTDVDKSAIEFAKKQFKRKNLTFGIEDALNLGFKNKSFDVVVCTHVYEHVLDPQKLFGEIYRVLKPGGVCYLAAINSWWPIEPHYKLLFLSWLPKKWADIYVNLTGKAERYYETPLDFWGLRRLTAKFDVHDYTAKIIADPVKYGYPKSWDVLRPLAVTATYFSPTFFWVLKKHE